MEIDTVFREGDNLVFFKDGVFDSETENATLPEPIGTKYFNCKSAEVKKYPEGTIDERIGEYIKGSE